MAYGTGSNIDFLSAAPRFVAVPDAAAPPIPETKRKPQVVTAVAVAVALMAGGVWLVSRPSGPPPAALPLQLEQGATHGYSYRSFWSASLDLGVTRRTLRADLRGYLALHVREVRADGSAEVTATMRAPTLIVNERHTFPKKLRTTMVLDPDGILVEGGTFRLPHGLVARVLPLGLAPPRPAGEVEPGGSWPVNAAFTDRGTRFAATAQGTFVGYEDEDETIAILGVQGKTRASGGHHHPRGRYSIEEKIGLDHRAGKVRWLQSHVSFEIRATAPAEMRRVGLGPTLRGSGTAIVELKPV